MESQLSTSHVLYLGPVLPLGPVVETGCKGEVAWKLGAKYSPERPGTGHQFVLRILMLVGLR